jgi:hypothetical protein
LESHAKTSRPAASRRNEDGSGTVEGSALVYSTGMNSEATVIGYYFDKNSNQRSFVFSPGKHFGHDDDRDEE